MPHSVVFLGTSPFAVASLRALAADDRFRVQLVITQPPRPVGRKQTLTEPPVKLAASQLHLPVLQPERLQDALSSIPPCEFLVVASYGQLLSEEALAIPSMAPINVHASLLPKLRGASPIQHAILQGDSETGITIQRMKKALDAGPILNQESIAIDPRATYQTLHDTLMTLGARLLIETLTRPLSPREQTEAQATFCRKLTKADGRADPGAMDAATIDRMVRALTPWPGVTIGTTKILETSLAAIPGALPVPCQGQTTLWVTTLQPASGKPMSGQAFLSGNRSL